MIAVRVLLRPLHVFSGFYSRNPQAKTRAFARLAFYVDAPGVTPGYRIDESQAEPDAVLTFHARPSGAPEHLEQVRQFLDRNPGSSIDYAA